MCTAMDCKSIVVSIGFSSIVTKTSLARSFSDAPQGYQIALNPPATFFASSRASHQVRCVCKQRHSHRTVPAFSRQRKSPRLPIALRVLRELCHSPGIALLHQSLVTAWKARSPRPPAIDEKERIVQGYLKYWV